MADDATKAKENRLSEQAALILAYEDIVALMNNVQENETQKQRLAAAGERIESQAVPENIPDQESRERFTGRLFKNFAPIRFIEKSTPTGHFFITSNLTKRPSMKSFFKTLPTSILSFLTPSIKIYKTFFINEKPVDWRVPFDNMAVKFGEHTSEFVQDADEILMGNGALPGVGIKSFSYEYKGVNPAEINTNIHATMEIFFQNPGLLVQKIPVGANDPRFVTPNQVNVPQFEFSYSDLINQVTRTINQNGEDKLNEKYYRIKIESGYADLPEHVLTDLLDNALNSNGVHYSQIEKDEIRDAIKSTKVILYLSPYAYDVNFNEDGSIILKINFQAAMDTLLSSQNSDIFIITEEGSKFEQLTQLYEDYLRAIRETPKSAEESISGKEEENCSLTSEQAQIAIENFNKYVAEKNPELQGKSKEEIAEELNNIRTKAYSSIYDMFIGRYNFIRPGNYPIGIWEAKLNGDIYKPKFKEAIKNNFGRVMVQGNEVIDPVTKKASKKQSDARALYSTISNKALQVKRISNTNIGPLIDRERVILKNKEYDQAVADAKEKLDKEINSATPYNVKFIFLGDLLDVAFEALLWIRPFQDKPIIYIGSVPVAIPIIEMNSKTNQPEITKNLRYIYPNLADIPISLNMFEDFFLRNVVEKKRTKYPVLEFVKDLISQLIVPAISPSMLGDQTAVAGAVRISTTYLTVNTDKFVDPITGQNILEQRTYFPPLDENALQRLIKYKNSGLSTNSTLSPINYLFLTCTSQFPKNKIRGIEEEDEQNSLLHFRMGTEYGIIKRISFSKVDIPYQREFMARREGQGKGTSIKQFYNSNIEMFGNDIFRPGDFIYIHPNYMFTQKITEDVMTPVASSASGPIYMKTKQTIDIGDKLGIGGYYLVTNVNTNFSPGQYSTTIKCSYQASVKRDPNNPNNPTVETANDNCAK